MAPAAAASPPAAGRKPGEAASRGPGGLSGPHGPPEIPLVPPALPASSSREPGLPRGGHAVTPSLAPWARPWLGPRGGQDFVFASRTSSELVGPRAQENVAAPCLEVIKNFKTTTAEHKPGWAPGAGGGLRLHTPGTGPLTSKSFLEMSG